jgi:hypothetical protein
MDTENKVREILKKGLDNWNMDEQKFLEIHLQDSEVLKKLLSEEKLKYILMSKKLLLKDSYSFLPVIKVKGIYLLCAEFHNKELLNDREIVKIAIKDCPNLLSIVSDKLKDDIRIVLMAFKCSVSSLKYASPRILSNKKFAISLINRTKHYEADDRVEIFKSFNESIQNDIDVVKEAIKGRISIIMSLNPNLRDNKEIGIHLLEININNIDVLSKKLQNDKDILSLYKKMYSQLPKHRQDDKKDDYSQKMNVLKRYEEEEWMNSSMEKAKKITKFKKF